MFNDLIQTLLNGSVAIRLQHALNGAAGLMRKATDLLSRVFRRWREEEELHRYLRSTGRSQRADLEAMGIQLPPLFPRPTLYGPFDPCSQRSRTQQEFP